MDKLESHILQVDEHEESILVLHENIGNYPWHSHKKGQLTYFDGGITVLHTENNDYYIPECHYLWIPPNTQYHYKFHNQTYLTRSIFINIGEDSSEEFFSRIGVYPVNNLLLEVLLFSEKWNGNIYPDDTVAYSFLKSMILLLPSISKQALPISLPITTNERMVPVLAYIHSNLNKGLSLESVGNSFGYSGRTLSRLFKTTLRTSFFQYLKMARMVKAIEMLLKTDKTISEIAFDVGYVSLSAFSNAFFELTNKRPSNFIKQK